MEKKATSPASAHPMLSPLPADKRADAEEAFNNYITLCPAAQSVVEAIQITHALEMADEG